MENNQESVNVIILSLNMGEPTAKEMQLAHRYVILDLAQLMVVGLIGVNGVIAL